MLEVEQSIDRYVLSAGDLRLAFHYEGDRWRHELAVRIGSEWQAVLVSHEGEPADAIPPSPPFQDLRLETIDDGTREFQLFGQAGHGAYSAAIRIEGAAQTVSFDVAARATRVGASICMLSLYRIPAGVAISRVSETEPLRLAFGGRSLFLTSPSNSPAAATIRIDAAEIAIGHSADRTGAPPRNARWGYCIGFSEWISLPG